MVEVPSKVEFDVLAARVAALESTIVFLKQTLKTLDNTVNPL